MLLHRTFIEDVRLTSESSLAGSRPCRNQPSLFLQPLLSPGPKPASTHLITVVIFLWLFLEMFLELGARIFSTYLTSSAAKRCSCCAAAMMRLATSAMRLISGVPRKSSDT